MKIIKDLLFNNIFFLIFIIFIFFNIIKPANSDSVLKIQKNDFVIGDIEAPITIIEYASLSCSHCASFHHTTLPILFEKYVEKGKINIVFRDFPLNYPALMGSMLLQCIKPNIRYEYLSALFLLQQKWVQQDIEIVKKELFKIFQAGGMTKEIFNDCLNNTELEQKILQGIMNAQNEFNIGTTPSFLINGKLVEGNKPAKDFIKIIDSILTDS